MAPASDTDGARRSRRGWTTRPQSPYPQVLLVATSSEESAARRGAGAGAPADEARLLLAALACLPAPLPAQDARPYDLGLLTTRGDKPEGRAGYVATSGVSDNHRGWGLAGELSDLGAYLVAEGLDARDRERRV